MNMRDEGLPGISLAHYPVYVSNQVLADKELKEAGWGGEGQDHFNMKRSADGKQRVGQCPVSTPSHQLGSWSWFLSLHFTMSAS